MGQTFDSLVADNVQATRSLIGPGLGQPSSKPHGANTNMGVYIAPSNATNFGVAAGPAINILGCLYFVAPFTGPTASLQVRISASGGVGSQYRIGVYDADQLDMFPTRLIFDSGDQDGTVVQVNRRPMGVGFIAGHLYFFAYICGTGAPSCSLANTATGLQTPFGTDQNFQSSTIAGWNGARGYGPLPDPWPIGINTAITVGQSACIGVRYA